MTSLLNEGGNVVFRPSLVSLSFLAFSTGDSF